MHSGSSLVDTCSRGYSDNMLKGRDWSSIGVCLDNFVIGI